MTRFPASVIATEAFETLLSAATGELEGRRARRSPRRPPLRWFVPAVIRGMVRATR
ncbi:MAG: hypothetical protein R3234_12715 [Thermoanaerobaculia bacterium]|nr:hypothetical protein [Thermoanaerobaculia bacterium]